MGGLGKRESIHSSICRGQHRSRALAPGSQPVLGCSLQAIPKRKRPPRPSAYPRAVSTRLSQGGLSRLSQGGLSRLSQGGLSRLSQGGLSRLSQGGNPIDQNQRKPRQTPRPTDPLHRPPSPPSTPQSPVDPSATLATDRMALSRPSSGMMRAPARVCAPGDQAEAVGIGTLDGNPFAGRAAEARTSVCATTASAASIRERAHRPQRTARPNGR